jgi:hypothetical protein
MVSEAFCTPTKIDGLLYIMPFWVWVIIICLVFLVSYDKRSGKLQDFFGPDIVEDPRNGHSERTTQSSGDTDESS